MITTLRTTNIFRVLDAIPAVTTVVDVYKEKPVEEVVKDGPSYMYLSKVTDNTTTGTDSGLEGWSLYKEAIMSFNIVAAEWTVATDELFDIIDVVNEEIVDEWCKKIGIWDGVKMKRVTELSATPIGYNIKNRAIITKQYLFTYYAK